MIKLQETIKHKGAYVRLLYLVQTKSSQSDMLAFSPKLKANHKCYSGFVVFLLSPAK